VEGEVPVFRHPSSGVVHSRGDMVGVNVLAFLKDNVRLDADSEGKIAAAFGFPDGGMVFYEWGGDRGAGSEASPVGDVEEDAVARLHALDFFSVLAHEADDIEAALTGDFKVVGTEDHHPITFGHRTQRKDKMSISLSHRGMPMLRSLRGTSESNKLGIY